MTTFTAPVSTDMTDWNLGDIAHGLNVVHTLNAWNVAGAGALYDYNFWGRHLTYSSGLNPQLTGGTIGGFTAFQAGVPTFTIEGRISAVHVAQFIADNDAAGLQREWFRGDDTFNGSAFSDHLLGYNGDDLFNLSNGGSDTVDGGNGNDTFVMGASFGATDHIEGGHGADTLVLEADYYVVCSAAMLSTVETVRLSADHDYTLHFVSENVGRGGLTVDASALDAGHTVEASMDSGNANRFTVIGGADADTMRGAGGRDHFTGNAGNDVFTGGGGADTLTGGTGTDVFVYLQTKESTGPHFDTITDFDSASDKISLDHQVNAVDPTFSAGALSAVDFNAGLATAVNGSVLGAHDAVLFTPDSGSFAGQTFLVIDGNGTAGYQMGEDSVILLSDTSHLGVLDTGAFLLNT